LCRAAEVRAVCVAEEVALRRRQGDVKAGHSALVVVNSSNVLGACAFCMVDVEGVAAVRAARYSITVGDGASCEIAPMVTTAS